MKKKKGLLTVLAGFAAAVGGVFLARGLINNSFDSFVDRLLKDPYDENLLGLFTSTRRIGPQALAENSLRAQSGAIINRPMGSTRPFPDFDGLTFNFAQLNRMPTSDEVSIATAVTLGPAAGIPLRLEIPLVITGMAYGYGLSEAIKIALAKGATTVGTASNTGEGPFLQSERAAARHLILQYNRGGWNKEPKYLTQADMIEIQFGQGAIGAATHFLTPKELDRHLREQFNVLPGHPAVIHSRQPGIEHPRDLKKLVNKLRALTTGIPIGVKLAPGKNLEEDLSWVLNAGIDVIALDGTRAATKGSPPILQDHFGLPTIFALVRAEDFLRNQGVKEKVSLIVSGGLFTPGDYLKAMALGADAVYLGTVSLLAVLHSQNLKSLPWEPPGDLAWYTGKSASHFNIKKGAQNVARFLRSSVLEMQVAAQVLGRKSLKDVCREDLMALDPFTAEFTGVEPAFHPPRQEGKR